MKDETLLKVLFFLPLQSFIEKRLRIESINISNRENVRHNWKKNRNDQHLQ